MQEQQNDAAGSQIPSLAVADEWLIGSALGIDRRRRAYVMHMLSPRFVARIVEIGLDYLPLLQEVDADLVSGSVYQADDTTVLCEVSWLDDVPLDARVQWLAAAAEAIKRATP